MAENFIKFESEIKQCFLKLDINYFIEDLKDLFDKESIKSINDSEKNEKVEIFLMEFNKLIFLDKFERLKKSAKKHNQWIRSFLSVDLNKDEEVRQLRARWVVLENLLELLHRSREKLCVMNKQFIRELYSEEVVTKANRDHLIQCLENYGEENALFDLFNIIHAKNFDWYGILLSILAQQDTSFMQIIMEEIGLPLDGQRSENKTVFIDYANRFIEKHILQYKVENLENIVNEDAFSDYASYEGSSIDGDQERELDSLLEEDNDNEIKPVELKLKKFQLELSELALDGKNVIIYAPTGTGKTVVAIHIANKHLENNPNGRVAFLVPRTPLVTQQYKLFEKFKNPQLKIMEMRGKSETTIGPLSFHINENQVFVMTSDILRNALTVDDGNMLNSISQFSLIFFDECHNCMKLHPYTKIMKEYFKEKRLHPERKLPQIVGLTASPRSNKKDDRIGMQKSLFELCANLDCSDFSMVKENMAELEEEMTLPKQEVLKIKQRTSDEFENALIEIMTKCEIKLAKMKVEGYFPASLIKSLPNNKFEEEYVGFVGNLEKLNTMTISENDGKQKAYSIYRYLNAYYRGLIVNQMFDEFYARQTISKYLKHNGKDFTCCYDEEFYNSYINELLLLEQSENPSIEQIKSLIQTQLKEKDDSRILIFVRQVDYTYYLVDFLKKTGNIVAEAIVGSNTKNILKGCTVNEMNDILTRFNNGDTKVLVATTVVEEGLDVGLCNMVISYGHVTNETALIQRRGRARSCDSRYVLILPPMLAWLEKKELLNERRKDMMMNLIEKFGQVNFKDTNMNLFILDYQEKNFFNDKKKPSANNANDVSWNFRCKKCQEFICTSEELRIIENMHRVCINPTILSTFVVSRRELQSFGTQGNYEIGGVIICKCQNSELGNYMLYKKIPYFQLSIATCNVESPKPLIKKEHSFKKWKDFAKHYTIRSLSNIELAEYCSKINELDI